MASVLSAFNNNARSHPSMSVVDADSDDDSSESETHWKKEAMLWKDRYHWSQRRGDALFKANNELKLELEQKKDACAQLMSKANEIIGHYHQKDSELAHALQVSSEREEALAHEEARNAELRALLEMHASELSVLRAFALPTEQITDVRVAEMVEEINYEMGQTAATLSDEYAEVPPSPGEYTKEALSSLDKRVSRGVAKVLASAGRSIEQDVAMQIALQACMSLRLNLAIQRWSFGSLADDGALKDVSKTISENEPEQVSRKWRSLTHQYARWTRQDRSKAQKTIVNHIKEHLADVLVAAGHASDHMMSLAAVHARVGAHVSNVVRLAFELNEVLGQGLGAYDMSPAHFSYGTTFDPETMQDGYPTTMPEDIDGRRGKVLCTTDLGLVRVMKGREDVLVKPKVALDALISPGY